MDLSFKDMKFMIESLDNLMTKYQERINQIEDLDEVSDLGNDIMFLLSLRKKIDNNLNNSLNPRSESFHVHKIGRGVIVSRKKSQKIIRIPSLKHLEPITKALTNLPNGHIKSEFDEGK